MSQQYRTADGSIWECLGNQGDGDQFNRIGSPDGGHDMDFRSQSLDEVLRYWGAMSLHDPLVSQRDILAGAMRDALTLSQKDRAAGDAEVMKTVRQLDDNGYEIVRKDRDA